MIFNDYFTQYTTRNFDYQCNNYRTMHITVITKQNIETESKSGTNVLRTDVMSANLRSFSYAIAWKIDNLF